VEHNGRVVQPPYFVGNRLFFKTLVLRHIWNMLDGKVRGTQIRKKKKGLFLVALVPRSFPPYHQPNPRARACADIKFLTPAQELIGGKLPSRARISPKTPCGLGHQGGFFVERQEMRPAVPTGISALRSS
jgi:hypothetical protein